MVRLLMLVTVTASMFSLPAAAQAPTQTTTAFDGTYVGISRTFEEDSTPFRAGATWTHYCPQPGGPPPPLTIVNGVARSGKFEGSISPQDFLVMRRPDGNRFDGRIDSQGTVKGRFTGVCSYLSVWQKAPESTTAFDGEYVGVSRESVRPASAQDAKCPPDGVSAPLTIWKGAVWSHGATWQGIVSQQGVLAMQNSKSTRLNGQIDAQGTI